MNRSARAVWYGTGQEGHGAITTDSGVLEKTHYSLPSRVAKDAGTSPEELLAAAHAACFNMALAVVLGDAGFKPQRMETKARLSFVVDTSSIRIQKVMLDLKAVIPDIQHVRFLELASEASKSCTISAVIKAEISLQVTLLN